MPFMQREKDNNGPMLSPPMLQLLLLPVHKSSIWLSTFYVSLEFLAEKVYQLVLDLLLLWEML